MYLGVNGNNGQRLRPTTFDQMAICKMYGCASTCGKQLSFCDNGEELFFSTRKCDGFNDCSDGSDEWGCPKKCCNAFTFQGQEYKLGKSNHLTLMWHPYNATCLKIPLVIDS